MLFIQLNNAALGPGDSFGGRALKSSQRQALRFNVCAQVDVGVGEIGGVVSLTRIYIMQGGQGIPLHDAFKTIVKLPGLVGANKAGRPVPLHGPSE